VCVPLVGGVPTGNPSVTLSLDGGAPQGGTLSSGTAEIGTARSGD
jgi:hypothetical protein